MPSVDVYTAIANPVRREILVRLRAGPVTVNDLARDLPVGRPAVSEHLQVLRRARLVHDEPRGRERWYHLDARPLAELADWTAAFTRYWSTHLDALDALLKETP